MTGNGFIPFLPIFNDKILDGRKTATSRTKRYGGPGTILETAFGARLRILKVTATQLGDVALHHFKEEGCATPEEFITIWRGIHQRRGYHPDDWVYLHEFEVVK